MWLDDVVASCTPPSGKERKIVHTPLKKILPMITTFFVLFFIIAWILIYFTDSNVPWIDSFTTALSFIGMWMLTYKYVQQWFIWIVMDAVSCGLYIYKDVNYTAALYGIYIIIAFFGYLKWKQIMKTYN